MNKLKIPFLSLFLILIMLTGCTKTGEDPDPNTAPDTRILSYVISSAAELDTAGAPTTNYSVIVYWAGTDNDGEIDVFSYSTDNVTWASTKNTTQEFIFDFANASATYNVYVKAQDNLGVQDATAATVSITRDYGAVETSLVDGPPNGAVVSTGVQYKLQAKTLTGTITSINWQIDDGALLSGNVATDNLGNATILITGLPSGAHVVYFAGLRDDGAIDETPVAVSLTARVGEFAPTIVNNSPVTPGGGWFSGVEIPFSWSVVFDYYHGALPETPFSFAFDDSTNFDLSTAPLQGGWVSDASTVFTPEAGDHDFFLKVRDAADQISIYRIDYEAASATFDEGVLVVNGIHVPTYGAQITDKVNNAGYWGDNLNVHFWDIFGTMTTPSAGIVLPGNAIYEGGGGAVGPSILARFSTVVWLAKEYQGDDEAYFGSPILPYLTAGGNLIFASRYSADFIGEGLTAWLNIGWREGSAAGSAAGSTIQEYVAVFPGLVDMGPPFRRIMSETSVYSSYPFNAGEGCSDDDITNWGGETGFSQDANTTMLFAHRSSAYDADYPFAYVRGLGVWSHPNFAFSSLTAGDEFPTNGTSEAKGNYILLNGRHYGFDDAACKTNFSFMLENMCAEQ